MNRSISTAFLVSVAAAFLPTASPAQTASDWPRFRGPDGLGVAAGAKPPVKWSAKENVVWKTALPGAGSSSPIVIGDKVFITCYSGYNVPGKPRGDMGDLRLHLVCLDRASGDIRWDSKIDPKLPEQANVRDGHGYTSATPVADNDRVYAYFGKSGAVAFDHQGKQLWRTDLGSGVNGFGSGASPILFNDLVIVNASIESESVVALDKKTGQEKWRVRKIREAFNTPTLVKTKAGAVELAVAMPRSVIGVDPATGSQLWTCGNDISWYIVPSIVAVGDQLWSFGGRSDTTAAALRAGGRGDVTKTHRLWTSKKGCNVMTPIHHDGRLYWVNDRGAACCAIAQTGEMVYESPIPRMDTAWASPLLADGKIYYLARNGVTAVVAADPKFEVLSMNDLRDGKVFNASPAVAGDRLFLRSDGWLYCVGTK